MKKFKYIIAFLLVYGVCDAGNFYVRSDGNNSACSGLTDASASFAPNCAKQSVQEAVNLANAGDTVIVRAGDYSNANPTFKTVRAGKEGSPITIRAAEGELVNVSRFQLDHQFTEGRGFRVVSATGFGGRGGIGVNASNTTVSNNIIYGTGLSNVGIMVWGGVTNVKIYKNTLEGKNTTSTSFDIGMYFEASNSIVSYNTVKNFDSIERAFEAYGNDITFTNNECYNWNQTDSSAHPDIFQLVSAADSMNMIVENNYFHDINAQIGNMWPDGGKHSWIFRNNIFANVTSAYFNHIDSYFYNNLFYRCGTVQNHPLLLYSGGSFSVLNNAFVGCGSGDASTRGWYDGADVKNYNFVSTISGGSKSGFNGIERNGINGGTLGFIAPNNNCVTNKCNFNIGENSTLNDKGTAIDGFSTDYEGQQRPQGAAWNIGPYEGFGNSSSLKSPSGLHLK